MVEFKDGDTVVLCQDEAPNFYGDICPDYRYTSPERKLMTHNHPYQYRNGMVGKVVGKHAEDSYLIEFPDGRMAVFLDSFVASPEEAKKRLKKYNKVPRVVVESLRYENCWKEFEVPCMLY